jgi:putative membrane-bound dehydrogenase-like protein
MPRFVCVLILLLVIASPSAGEERKPRALDPRIRIELFASAPQIVTPTGIDVDHRGRVWAIESNTHFRPDDYQGHSSDRVLVMSDTNADGQADSIVTFADGLTHAMSLAVRPSGAVYVATRKQIVVYRDNDGDLRADSKKRIVRLDTPGNYPHDGLAGFAFDAMDWMYFGLGENLGAKYKLIGSDGTTLTGGGEGGNLYRCRLDGTKLTQWATGFWNPHASCVDAFGRLFSVDNDPDSRPPCRLLHIIPGGDYGFRFRNGRKGLHPFTSWNGEIPGTLPMVSGTGEAPSGIVAYESDGLPKDYVGNLLVTSWGDHRIDRFRLRPKGASFQSVPETVIQGDENFRPVGLAVAPDGSLFCTDWVLRDYKLHGKGRVWRISAVNPPSRKVVDVTTITAKLPVDELNKLLTSPRIDVRRSAAQALIRTASGIQKLGALIGNRDLQNRFRNEAFWAVERWGSEKHSIDLKHLIDLYLEIREIRGRRNRGAWSAWHYEQMEGVMTSVLDGRIEFELLLKERHSKLNEYFEQTDPFVFAALVDETVKHFDEQSVLDFWNPKQNRPARARVAGLLAARRKNPKHVSFLKLGLRDSDPSVRRTAVQWVAEERLAQFRGQLKTILNSEPMTTDLFLATLAALEMLDGKSPHEFDKTPASKYVLPLLKDARRSPAVRAQALRLVAPDDPVLDATLLQSLLGSDNRQLKLETVRTLQSSPLPEAADLLAAVAADGKNDLRMRAEALVGLGRRSANAQQQQRSNRLLVQLLESKSAALRSEALRSLRGQVTSDATVKQAIERLAKTPHGLQAPLAHEIAMALGKNPGRPQESSRREKPDFLAGGDAEAGRRIFFHSQSAGCYKCHTVHGRGGKVGPDLSAIGRTQNRKRMAESILEPSKEIAPQFTTWTLVMKSGKVHSGIFLGDTRDNVQRIGTTEGNVLELPPGQIDARKPHNTSIMPQKLVERLTAGEFRDLLAFLETLK